MQLRISPEDIEGTAVRVGDDGPALLGLAALAAVSRGPAAVGTSGHTVVARALDEFLECQQAAFTTLADTAQLLAHGLNAAAAAYRDNDTRVGLLFGAHR